MSYLELCFIQEIRTEKAKKTEAICKEPKLTIIAQDKRMYQENSFLISPRKHVGTHKKCLGFWLKKQQQNPYLELAISVAIICVCFCFVFFCTKLQDSLYISKFKFFLFTYGPDQVFYFSNNSLSLTALITALKLLICNIYIAWHKWVLFVYFCRLLNVLCKNYYKYIIQSNFSGSNIFGTMEICSRDG